MSTTDYTIVAALIALGAVSFSIMVTIFVAKMAALVTALYVGVKSFPAVRRAWRNAIRPDDEIEIGKSE